MRQVMFRLLLGAALALGALVGFLYINHDIGVSAGSLEHDLRTTQRIPEDWQVVGSVSDAMAAYLSYPQDLSDHTYSVYVNRPGLSFGYFFREGGDLSCIQSEIMEVAVEGCPERAFLSMNQQRAAHVEIDTGSSVQVIEIDPERPFAIVLPVHAGRVSFYDADGNAIGAGREPF